MKIQAITKVLMLGVVLLSTSLIAHTDEWKTGTTKDGITVKSNVSKRTNDKGEEVQVIEYVATTTARVSMAKCIATLKDISKHKDFLDEDVSEEVKPLSANEWLVYYYFKAPWPMPDADCVTRMVLTQDATKKTATFSLKAAPSLYEKKDVDRMDFYNVMYSFKDLGNGNVEMTITTSLSPIVQVPDWMVRGYFPEGPADILRKITQMAKS